MMKLQSRTSTAAAVAAALSLLFLCLATFGPQTVGAMDPYSSAMPQQGPYPQQSPLRPGEDVNYVDNAHYTTQNDAGESVTVFPLQEGQYQDEFGNPVDGRGNLLRDKALDFTPPPQEVPAVDRTGTVNGGRTLEQRRYSHRDEGDEWTDGNRGETPHYPSQYGGGYSPDGHRGDTPQYPQYPSQYGGGYSSGVQDFDSRMPPPGRGMEFHDMRSMGTTREKEEAALREKEQRIEEAISQVQTKCNIIPITGFETFKGGEEFGEYVSPKWIARNTRNIYKAATKKKRFFKAIPFTRKWNMLKADWMSQRCKREEGHTALTNMLNIMYQGDSILPTLHNLVTVALTYQFWGSFRMRKCFKPFFKKLRQWRTCQKNSDFWKYVREIPMCSSTRWELCTSYTAGV